MWNFENQFYDSEIDKSCYIDLLAKIENSVLESNTNVYKLSWIKDCVVRSYSSIGDNSKVERSTLSSYVRIGRFNHIYCTDIGAHSYTGPSTVMMHSVIGKFTSISWGVTVGPANHDYSRVTNHSFLYNDYDGLKGNNEEAYDRFESKCVIGNDVWIGANSTILRDVRIGDGAVIGANSVVTKDVPPYAIVVGVPAKVIKFRFDEDIIEKLRDIKWWEFPDEVIRDNFSLFKEFPDKDIIENLKKLCQEKL